MKMKNFKIYPILLGLLLALFACQPEEFNLGKLISQDELAYRITQDPADPNKVILQSLTPGATPLWITPMGRSTRINDTLLFPFAGEYEFVYGVQSAGGLVQSEPYHLNITTNNFDYVNDPLWEMISGGVGHSKTWYLDLDAGKTSRFFGAPIWFFTSTYKWKNLHSATGNYIDTRTWKADEALEPNLTNGEATWYWKADWIGNQWMCDAADFGTMKFDLIGNANVVVDQEAYGLGKNTGTYMLDAKNFTIKFNDAYPLHDTGRNNEMKAATELRLLYLSDDFMQILVVPSGVCYNYISKDYRDNWVAPNQPDPEPQLPDGWQDDVSVTVSYEVKWVLSSETPFNWCRLDGSLMNNWNSVSDYPEWTGFNASIPATYANFSLTLNSQDKTVKFVAPNGTTTQGSYTLDEKGIYTFAGVKPEFNICSWVNLSTTADNQWRIMRIEKNASGAVTGMWVGAKDPVKPEYMAYKLIPQLGTSTPNPMAPWENALVGKTFIPDVNWFVDWVTSPPNFAGGWTSSSTFGTDYTSNNWIWTADTRAVAEAATLYFFKDGSDLKCTKTQGASSETSIVNIDPAAATLVFEMELINYDGSPASWLPRGGPGVVWHFVSHGGSNLTNINTNGLWLGFENAKPGEGGKPDGETTLLHYLVKP